MDTTTQGPPPLSRRMLAPKEFSDEPLDRRVVFGRAACLVAGVASVLLTVGIIENMKPEDVVGLTLYLAFREVNIVLFLLAMLWKVLSAG